MIDLDSFTYEEKTVFSLRSLYEKYGYKKYKMSRFEEYELYAKNRSFLESENIITFTDQSGRLMALKPDVTLSIVKNTLAGDNFCDVKYHYNEDVFRVDPSTHELKTIMQVGVEHIGKIDLYSTAEAVCLAKRSLTQIDENNILDLSHLGFVSGLLSSIDEPIKSKLIHYIGEKNAHDILTVAEQNGIDPTLAEKIAKLSSLYGPIEQTLKAADELIINDEMKSASDELHALYETIAKSGFGENINLDFSIVNDMNYYNGIIFQGYVKNVPSYILSGGRYDRLIEKMGGKGISAIGFAIYLDLIDLYNKDESEKSDCDVLIIYDDNTSADKLLNAVMSYVNTGRRVITQNGENGRILAEDTVDMRGNDNE